MEQRIYDKIAAQENTHWWFRARRIIIRSAIARLHVAPDSKILEAGCCSGGNLPMLSSFGRIFGFEMNEGARRLAEARHICPIEYGKLPDDIPFEGIQFDLIALLDVLEHIQDDHAALDALYKRLQPGGAVILSVPAFHFLTSHHDVMNHHFRRYERKELMARITQAGFTVEFINYWNCWLFPVAIAVRLLERIRPPKGQSIGLQPLSPWLNTLMTKFVASERFFHPWIRLPFGVSLIAVARKPR